MIIGKAMRGIHPCFIEGERARGGHGTNRKAPGSVGAHHRTRAGATGREKGNTASRRHEMAPCTEVHTSASIVTAKSRIEFDASTCPKRSNTTCQGDISPVAEGGRSSSCKRNGPTSRAQSPKGIESIPSGDGDTPYVHIDVLLKKRKLILPTH